MATRGPGRAQKWQDYMNQNISSGSDFNFDQHNRKGVEGTHVSGQEVRALRASNKNKRGGGRLRDNLETLRAQKEAGATFGNRAERQYQSMEKRVGAIDDAQADMTKIENLPEGMDPSDPDVRKAFRGKGWGKGDQARYDKIIAAKQKAKAAGGGSGQQQNPIDQTVTGETDSAPKNQDLNHAAVMPHDYEQRNTTDIYHEQKQNVNQNNDINTDIDGNNNTVVNNQDNSIRQYGGDQRSFVYNSNGGNGYTDTPASMATLAGFFAPDDSPAAQAKFNDMYTTMNADNQKRYAGSAMETYAKYGKIDARGYTPESMANHIGRSTQYSYDRADRQTGLVFGDIWNKDYITEDWKMPTPPKAIESDAKDIADDAKDDIDDV